ncbi:MAG: hypothetical protein JKY52_00265 [Flavobacteriales bacterium]|nr:hypothetical protein [Flavobacteriales bacterium]
MTDTEFSISHIHQDGIDTGTFISIYTKAIRMNRQSDEEGREIYEDRVYIKIEPPGQTKSIVNRPIKDDDKVRFKAGWDKFESGKECQEGGTPIERLGDLPLSRYKELRATGFRTIEQLANAPDSKIGFIGPDSLNLKKQAKLFLAGQTEDSVKLQELEAENSAMKDEMAEMKEMLEQLTAAEAKPSTPKRRGRPPKNDTADHSEDSPE